MASITDKRKTLTEAIEEVMATGVEFKSVPHYSAVGDCLTLFLSPDPAYAERVDEMLTVYRSFETEELVGCKIKGVSLLAHNVATFIGVNDAEVELRFLLMNANGPRKAAHHYYDLVERAGNVKVFIGEMLRAA